MQSKRSRSSRAGGVGTILSLVLLATLLTMAAAMFSFRQLQPDIERDLNARVATALQDRGVSDFSIDGQDVILAGAIDSEAASKSAVESVRSVYGVGRVINKLTIDGIPSEETITAGIGDQSGTESGAGQTEEAPLVIENNQKTAAPPSLTIASRDGRISIQGIVPDQETIERVNTALAGKFGRNNVRDELSSFEGSESPLWLNGMLSMIDQLDGIEDPILKVTGQDLILGGTVNAQQIRRVKVATAERLLGAELNVIDNLTVISPDETPSQETPSQETPAAITEEPEVAENTVAETETTDEEEQTVVATTALPTTTAPSVTKRQASIEIDSTNNQITLTGFVSSQADASGLREGLDNLFGVNGYFDELTISDSVESADWIDDALIVTSEIRDVPEFAINIRAGQMSLSGSVEDRETARDLSIAATEIAGDKLGVLNNFSVNNVGTVDSDEDLLAQSLLQELDALPTENIIFNKNSTTLTDSAKEVLDDVAAAILGYNDLVVEIAGHTDSSGDAVRNLRLSKQRATAVQDYLLERNVPGNRLSPIGYGETAPISDNDTDAGRAANRRIEFNL